MSIKLYRCSNIWVKIGGHPCWRVQSALDAAGIDYQVVKGPVRRSKRGDLERLSGQRRYPVIEFEDGTVYREESHLMAERIRSGKLMEQAGGASSQSPEAQSPEAQSPEDHSDEGHDHDGHDHDRAEHATGGPPA